MDEALIFGTNGVVDELGRQPRLDAVLVVEEIGSRLAYIDALVAIWAIAGDGRDLIEARIRAAFRDLEALNLMGEILAG